MFKNKAFLVVIAFSIFLLSACSTNIEGVAIQVNKEIITVEEYEREFEVYKNLYERQYGEDALSQEGINGETIAEELKDNIISKLITEALIEKESRDKNFQINEEQLQKSIDEYKESIGGEEKYLEFLANNSISEEYFRENMRETLLLEEHKENIMKDFDIKEDEAIKYFNENKEGIVEIRASHILFSNEQDAKRVLEQLQNGEDFEELAKLESLDSVSAINGGDLGYFSRGSRIPEFEERAFLLDIGEISEVLKTEVGYHIILVKDKKEDYKELKDKTINLIKEEKYLEYLDSLRDNAKITIYIE
ncbi:MAG: peptidylprolyl isomerase [Gudongella sp.]|nr:peptidylprolyl isomerase [Gudongella sp.]